MDSLIDDNSLLQFTSTCHIEWSLSCCDSYSLFIADSITSCILAPHEEQLHAVVTASASWLNRNQHSIKLQTLSECQASHHCIIPRFSFEQLLFQVSSLILQWLNGTDEHNLISITSHDETTDLYLEVKCTPKFSISPCMGCSLCTSFVIDEIKEYPDDSLLSIVLAWIQRNQAQFVVTDTLTGVSTVPNSIETVMEILLNYISEKITQLPTPPDPLSTPPVSIQDVSKKASDDSTTSSLSQSTNSVQNTKTSSPKKLSPSRHKYQTRKQNSLLSREIVLGSKSRNKVQYNDGKGPRRFMHGDPFKISPSRITCPNLPLRPSATTIADREAFLDELQAFHNVLKSSGLHSPRDAWEEWMDMVAGDDKLADKAFMCLIIILMSSSTTDSQLAAFIPKIFSAGVTSADGVLEVVDRIGIDSFCALISPVGRFHQNAERIVHSASYFVTRYNGRIPKDISIRELTSLFGIGYKTAQIVVSTAFDRIDGIPSDVHVMRWCEALKWTPPLSNDGLLCSKCIEQWLPPSKWGIINPLFGGIGQLIQNPEKRPQLLALLDENGSDMLQSMIRLILKAYGKY